MVILAKLVEENDHRDGSRRDLGLPGLRGERDDLVIRLVRRTVQGDRDLAIVVAARVHLHPCDRDLLEDDFMGPKGHRVTLHERTGRFRSSAYNNLFFWYCQ